MHQEHPLHPSASAPFSKAAFTAAANRQLSLALDRWPTPLDNGHYDIQAAHRQAFEQRCAAGRVCIELWVLEVVPDLFIQASSVVLGAVERRTPLKLTARNRHDSPEAALRAAAWKAAREFRSTRRNSGLYPEHETTLLRAGNWLDDVLQQCDYLLERQTKLFA